MYTTFMNVISLKRLDLLKCSNVFFLNVTICFGMFREHLCNIHIIKTHFEHSKNFINVTLEHKSSHKQHSYICSNSQQYIVWVKIIIFYFMPKIIRY